MRKKVDSRIRTLIENCAKTRQRAMLVLVGDKGRDQVVNLHYMLSKASVKARPSVLWCYKKELHLSRWAHGSRQAVRAAVAMPRSVPNAAP
jgi:N-acetyltransferase 10